MKNKKYDVALSFAGEDRAKATELAYELKKIGLTVFYDEYEQAYLWGKDLYQHLQSVYRDQSQYCVIFVSRHYYEKIWTKHELKSAQARAFRENSEYILPLRLDKTEIPGINDTTGYVEIGSFSISLIAEMIAKKVKNETFLISKGYILELNNIHDDFVFSLVFSPEDKYLISGGKDFSINVFDLKSNNTIHNFKSNLLESWCLAMTDHLLVAGFWQRGIIQVWDTSKWTLIREIDAHALSVRAVEFTPDKKFLGSCAHDGKIKLWDLKSSEPIIEFQAHPSPCTSISFSSDGKSLASSGDEGTVIVWDMKDQCKLYGFHPDIPSHALSVKFSLSSRYVIACFADITPKSNVGNCVKIWDTENGQLIHTLVGHTEWVWCLAIHPNHRWVASGSYDGTVIVWEIETGYKIGKVLASIDRVYAVAFSNDGTLMATTGWDKCVRVWDLDEIIFT